jgi:hypothetical protein
MATQWSVLANRKDKRGQKVWTEFRVDAVSTGGCPAQAGAIVLLDSCGKIDLSLLPAIPSSSCCIELEVNGVKVPDQNVANFVAQNNIEITYDSQGGIYFNVVGTPSSCAEYLCTPSGCPIDVGISAPTHPGMMLISQPGNCTAVWADPQVQGLYPAGSTICPAPAYTPPTCIQPIGIGIQDPNGDLQWLQGSYAGSPATLALDVNVVNPLTVTFSESSICVTQCTTPWVVTDTAAEASLATIAADLSSLIITSGSPAAPALNVNVETSEAATYHACQSAFTPLSNGLVGVIPFFTIRGSATKVIKVRQIKITWACTTGNSALNVIRLRRYSGISGGAFNVVTPTPDDILNPAATAVISQYSTLPAATPFNLGSIDSEYMQWTTNTSSLVGPPAIVWDFGVDGGQAATLRGVSDWFGIEVAAVAAAGALMTIKVMWTEE